MANTPCLPDIDLRIELNSSAPEALQKIGVAYWEMAGLDPRTGGPVWTERIATLDYKIWSGTANYAAAAAVTVTAPEYSCGSCGGKLTLTSRQALTDALQDKNVDCRSCHATIEEQVGKILSPQSLEIRLRRTAEHDAREKAAEAERNREQGRRETIINRYRLESGGSNYLLSHASLSAKIGALAVLHAVGDRDGLIYPIDIGGDTIGPTSALSTQLFTDAWHSHLLQIHPSTPIDAFVWDDDTTLGNGIFIPKARFFVPGEGTPKQRLESFAPHLRAELDLSDMWSTQRTELGELVHHIIAEEAGRYLVSQLRAHNLPDLTETHEEALRTSTMRGAALFSIGHLYRMGWSAARDASSAYQRNAGMSKNNAITYGLKQFERWVQRAIDDPEQLNAPFDEDKSLPLAAVTAVVFRVILGLDPMAAGPADIAGSLEGAPDAELLDLCNASIPDRHELMEWILTSTGCSGDEFRRALARLEGWEPDLCAPHCAHERISGLAGESGRIYDRIVTRVGETDAVVLTAEATAIANSLQDGMRTGDALLGEAIGMIQALGGSSSRDIRT
ncbi:hypothetical protein QM646_01910 [Rhodococcus erythropolis]|nr:hypothetical protein [Rhodococcus erythropolis]